jgi:23S rRNA pseudouridine1911/1915/1917 synthase
MTFRQTDSKPESLMDFLQRSLPKELNRLIGTSNVSRSKLRRLIVAGATSINGRQIRKPETLVTKGVVVTVKLDTEKFSFEKQPDDIKFDLTTDRILFEDEAIIVVDKPANFPTEATMVQTRDYLQAAVQRFLLARDGNAANGEAPYVGLHHRLDRETSGVILFTKQRRANTGAHKMFLEHLAKKEYMALVIRPQKLPPRAFSVDNFMDRITPKSARGKWGAVRTGGERALTNFKILEEHTHGLLVQANPETGRTHQIRVHLSGLQMPLYGDDLYGGPNKIGNWSVPRIMLHATSLTFPHPIDGREICVTAPIPQDFQECLSRI